MSAFFSIASIWGSSQPCIAAASSERASLIFLIRSSMASPLTVQRAAEFLRPLVDDALGLELVARKRLWCNRFAAQAHMQSLMDLVAQPLRNFVPCIGG